MLNFEEELQKFKPSMEIDDIEDALYQESLAAAGPVGAESNERTDRETRE